MKKALILSLFTFILLQSCGPGEINRQETSNLMENLRIETGISLRKTRLKTESKELHVVKKDSFSLLAETQVVDPSFKLTLVGELEAPTFDGIKLQATDTVVEGNRLFVSYATRGELKKGAVDLVNITNPSSPFIVSQLVLPNRDVNAMAYLGDSIFLTGSKVNSVPSFAARVALDSEGFTTDIHDKSLIGYAGNDIMTTPTEVYVTTGQNGGVFVLNSRTFASLSYSQIFDARSVGYDPIKKEIWTLTGQPGSLVKLKKNGEILNNFELGGANLPGHKSTVQVGIKWALATLGENGFAMVCKENGQVVQEMSPPVIKNDLSVPRVTNAAVAFKSFIFSANGEEGVHIYKMSQVSENANCTDLNLSYIGYIDFGDELSANHISVKGDFLYIADGLGGLKIVHITKVIIINSENEVTDFNLANE